jgi:hypothetical protein
MHREEKYLCSLPEDIEDVLIMIEKSYDIKFETNELVYIKTFGQLTDHIISKIKLEERNDCTDQQAFYKLHNAIMAIKGVDNLAITPKTQLVDIFPEHARRREITEVEKQLGFGMNALRPQLAVTISLIILLLLSFIGLFIKWQYGLAAFFFSIAGLWISEKMGKVFVDNTVGELVDRMTRLNYVKSRRQPGTVNLKEVRDKIEKLFIENLGLGTRTIDRDTIIY